MTRSWAIAALAGWAVLNNSLLADQPSPPSAPRAAVAQITGPLICAHCDLGIGDECCAGIRIDEAVVILGGKANQACLDDRLSGAVRRVRGTLRATDGNLYLDGEAVKQTPAAARPEMLVTGRVVQRDGTSVLANGKQDILLRGAAADAAGRHDGQWVAVRGVLDVDRKGRIRLTAKAVQPTAEPPALPQPSPTGEEAP